MKQIPVDQKSYLGEPSLCAFSDGEYCAVAYQADGASGAAVHLAVHRLDMRDGITWDVLQRIKRDCGYGDKDALEAYPRDSDVINTGNIRHLYIFDSPIPFITRAK